MEKTADLYKQSFWLAMEKLGQQKRYKVAWENGEMTIRPFSGNTWKVGVIDEFKHAFVHFDVAVAGGTKPLQIEKEGYYLPGIGADKAEQIILNYVFETFSGRNGGIKNDWCAPSQVAAMPLAS